MTEITYRNYRGAGDLQLQYTFWTSITRKLPWCWKPTLSPEIFLRNTNYAPQSRWFAFDGERLIGYMSFSGKGEFVSLGYPWVEPGYEGKIQHDLYDLVYGYAASSEYGGRIFAQRFRSDWTKQIEFFSDKGFTITGQQPIYILDVLSTNHIRDNDGMKIRITDSFDFEKYKKLAEKTLNITTQDLDMLEEYFASVDFDFALEAQKDESAIGYFGVTVRKDTGFAEINAVALDVQQKDMFDSCIGVIASYVRKLGVRHIGLKGSLAPNESMLRELGFRHVCDELMMMKSL